jgi:hypothetical protein
MDSPLPTRESFILGAKLALCCKTPDILAAVKESREIVDTMTSIEEYERLVFSLHSALHHTPDILGECHAQQHALASIMSQMFAAGYAAGRQEIIDAELAKAQIFSDFRRENRA